jgi:hypothetical protein
MICVTIYLCMMEEIRMRIHKKMAQLNKYIKKHIWKGDAKWNLLQLDNDKYVFYVCVRILNMYFMYVLEYLIDKRGREIDNSNY